MKADAGFRQPEIRHLRQIVKSKTETDLATDYADYIQEVTISDSLKFCPEIRAVTPINLLKICEIGGICGCNCRGRVLSPRSLGLAEAPTGGGFCPGS